MANRRDMLSEPVEGEGGGEDIGIHDTRGHSIMLPNGRQAPGYDPEFSLIRKLDGREAAVDDRDWDQDRSNAHIV